MSERPAPRASARPGTTGPSEEPIDTTARPEFGPDERRAAAEIFGDRLALVERFVDHLCTSGIERGLVGPREVPRMWQRHVLGCGVFHELIRPDARVCDVGSGAGLPGLVLALARPDLRVTLVEPMDRRTTWLAEVADDLGVSVEIVRARAEELHGQRTFDVVTARAVAALDKLSRWCLPLVASSGELLAMKGRSAEAEVDAAAKVLRKFKVSSAEVLTCDANGLEQPTTIVRLVRAAASA
ncbi:16S rRNA (guanine(527)-N(7))-methyltransferase RsmG [Micrococcales bacterium 31B]|nr:16S rRNA (guanine(527)-N(7))-methyltransferase RsmG [Micrococcales bacterium 31B]